MGRSLVLGFMLFGMHACGGYFARPIAYRVVVYVPIDGGDAKTLHARFAQLPGLQLLWPLAR